MKQPNEMTHTELDAKIAEVIIWHRYPEEKPECKSYYLVCMLSADTPAIIWWDGNSFYGLGYPDAKRFNEVYAWAETPKGYKLEEE